MTHVEQSLEPSAEQFALYEYWMLPVLPLHSDDHNKVGRSHPKGESAVTSEQELGNVSFYNLECLNQGKNHILSKTPVAKSIIRKS